MDDMQGWLAERQTVYSVLSSLYQDNIDQSSSILQKKMLLQQLLPSLIGTVLEEDAIKISKEMDHYQWKAEYQEVLGSDYQRLFTGPGHLWAPLWESFYCTTDKLLFGEPERAVRACYQAVGLEVSPHEPADHLALELAFMARLCVMAAADPQGLLQWLGKQDVFLQEHLLQWVPVWTREVLCNAQTEFCQGMAIITQEWLKRDVVEIAGILDGYARG